jgi:hypothetical protein
LVSDLLRYFQLAAVLQIRRDPGRAESMIADACLHAGRFRTPADDAVGVLLEEGIGCKPTGLAAGLVSAWMVLCGPATESHTYLLLAPALVLGMVQSFNRWHPAWLRALVCAAFVLQLVNHTRISYLFHLKDQWIFSAQPISALLFLGYCFSWLLTDPFLPARPALNSEGQKSSSCSSSSSSSRNPDVQPQPNDTK